MSAATRPSVLMAGLSVKVTLASLTPPPVNMLVTSRRRLKHHFTMVEVLSTRRARLGSRQSVVRHESILGRNRVLGLKLMEYGVFVKLGQTSLKVKVAQILHIRCVFRRPPAVIHTTVAPGPLFQCGKWLERGSGLE